MKAANRPFHEKGGELVEALGWGSRDVVQED